MNKPIGKIIELPKIADSRGNLTVAEEGINIPFCIQRVNWSYGIPTGAELAGFALKQGYQLLIALSGSFTVELDDGCQHNRYLMEHPYQGLLIPPATWVKLREFAEGSVYIQLNSATSIPNNQLNDYQEFLNYIDKK